MPHKVDPALKPVEIKVYHAVREAWRDYGVGPTRRELTYACNCAPGTAAAALRVLRRAGYLVDKPFTPRSIRPVDIDLTLSREPLDPWATLDDVKFWKPRNG